MPTLVNGVSSPVVQIDGADAAHQQFQFVFIEQFDQTQRYEFVEALQEVLHLLQNPIYKSPLDDQFDVVQLVFVGYLDIRTARL